VRKLTESEENALTILVRSGSITPGGDPGSVHHVALRALLDGLVKKKRAVVNMTDDGPRYEPAIDA
jgi:hypothetical protein